MRSRQCIFCPNIADSKEHIWSNWILELLPNAKDGVFTRRLPDGSYHSRPATKPDQRVRIVCTKCNTGWMSTKLEGPMKAITSDIILNNKQKTFSSQDRKKITEWAFKTTILANHIDLHGKEPFFSEENRYAFARDLSVPGGVHVWVSQRNAGFLTATYRSVQRLQQPSGALTPHLVRPPESPYRFKTYTCTFVIGYLLLQVVAARWAKREVSQRLTFPTIRQPQILDNYATAVWPNNGFSINWPPPRPVGNALFNDFWDRFSSFNLPNWMS